MQTVWLLVSPYCSHSLVVETEMRVKVPPPPPLN